ncbi:hypothetical protein OOJ91_13855 [Micromonospora lupini]|uniref:hypothetical protein n=1 Tax=Micromonospora lupini TaxID=285679 RepID=UPI0022523CCD|nr:hypothetical protein [Micromonospora lupini]MCX5066932.1 hypothetical protein [Micromonospora lupini]
MTTTTKAAPTDTGACGERAGYSRHRVAGEQPCRPCMDANNAANQARRRRLRPRPPMPAAVPLTPRSPFGRLAALPVLHRFRGVSQCRDCFGWWDDPRHVVL